MVVRNTGEREVGGEVIMGWEKSSRQHLSS